MFLGSKVTSTFSSRTMGAMLCEDTVPNLTGTQAAKGLLGSYIRLSLWFVLGVILANALGVESIYMHVTPFHAVYSPVFGILGNLLVLILVACCVGLALFISRRHDWFGNDLSPRALKATLAGLFLMTVLLAGAIAMMRGGLEGIAAPYMRSQYEYVNDIGRGMSIRGLFSDYLKLHPFLSMHSKVHPPGPVAVLWVLSFLFGREALGLSIGTILFGSLAVFPLFYWVRDVRDQRTALICCLLYTLTPTILLFTATSADILFMPFTIGGLFLFWRAIHRKSIAYALGAGVLYALMSLLSFSLVSIGAFFGFVGLWRLADPAYRVSVFKTALVMLVAFVAVHGLVYLWSGFNVIECFHVCKAQFEEDQRNLDMQTPRYASYVYKLLNPLTMLFFAGIPLTVLFLGRLSRVERETKAVSVVCLLTLLVLNMLYLGRGEGERSAMYIIPFMVIPAACMLERIVASTRSLAPLSVTLAFLIGQCWLIETFLYTYW
ncbi:MAG: glycosyltransferase family 39 protein [Candidatus Hydrogenedentes bacterium]|nr:glycosyltransferase family 39 protein [Candidatus Hydrogenedentota bacterium]